MCKKIAPAWLDCKIIKFHCQVYAKTFASSNGLVISCKMQCEYSVYVCVRVCVFVCVWNSVAQKVMPSAYCCFPLSILFLLPLAFICCRCCCCCCLLSYGLSVAQRLSVQWCSGAVLGIILFGSYCCQCLCCCCCCYCHGLCCSFLTATGRKWAKMTKLTDVHKTQCTHTNAHTHAHTQSSGHRLGQCARAVRAHLMALGPMPLDRIYERKVQNFTCIWFMLALNSHAMAAAAAAETCQCVCVCTYTFSYILQHFSEQMSWQCPGK